MLVAGKERLYICEGDAATIRNGLWRNGITAGDDGEEGEME